MVRQIIEIDAEKCNGCGICASACHEGAIGMVDGKATLLRDDYCDGFGDCLPACPAGAISFIQKDTVAYDEKAVEENKNRKLGNWPIQIKLAPPAAPYFDGAHLLVAADCTAYAYADFYRDYIKGKTTLIGCPKLDNTDYSEKLTEIIKNNDIQAITVVRMEVPCCGGIEMFTKMALQSSGKNIPCQVVTISIEGKRIS